MVMPPFPPINLLADAAAAEALVKKATKTARNKEEVDSTFYYALHNDQVLGPVEPVSEQAESQRLEPSREDFEQEKRQAHYEGIRNFNPPEVNRQQNQPVENNRFGRQLQNVYPDPSKSGRLYDKTA